MNFILIMMFYRQGKKVWWLFRFRVQNNKYGQPSRSILMNSSIFFYTSRIFISDENLILTTSSSPGDVVLEWANRVDIYFHL